MQRIGMLALLLSACTGTYYPSSSGQPQYASSTTTQTTAQDGTVTTSTETATYEAYPTAQPATYPGPNEPPPPPPAAAPPPPPPAVAPPPPSAAAPCHRRDTPDMCVALQVLFDIGAILQQHEDGSCRSASRALNRYADAHRRELETFQNLDKTHSQKQLRDFQKRHEGHAAPIMSAALALDTRCEGDQKLDRALQRVGFTGMVGHPAL